VVSPSELRARRAGGTPSPSYPFSCGLLLDSSFSLQCEVGCSSSPSCGSSLVFMGCSGCSCGVLCFCCTCVSKAPRGVPSEPSVLSAVSRDRCPFGGVCRYVERRGVALHAGRVLSERVLCMYSKGSTEFKHTQQSRARSTRQFGAARLGFFISLLFFVAEGRVPREGFKGRMRPKAL